MSGEQKLSKQEFMQVIVRSWYQSWKKDVSTLEGTVETLLRVYTGVTSEEVKELEEMFHESLLKKPYISPSEILSNLEEMLGALKRKNPSLETFLTLLTILDRDSFIIIKPKLQELTRNEECRIIVKEISDMLLDYAQHGVFCYDMRYGLWGLGTPLTQVYYQCAVNAYSILGVSEEEVKSKVDMKKVMRDR